MISNALNATLDVLVTLRSERVAALKNRELPYIGLEHIAQGAPRLLGSASSDSSTSANSVFSKDDILFGKLRPYLRKSIRAPFDGYCSTDILVLRCRDGILPSFAAHVFQWEEVFRYASATSAGTKMPRTSWNDLKRCPILAPPTEAEQSSIATVLDLVDRAIADTELIVSKLQQIRAGLIHDLVTRGIDETGKMRDPLNRPDGFKDTTAGRIPQCWETIRVCDAGEVRLGRQRSPAQQHGQHIRPYLRVANVFDGFIDYSDILSMNFEPHEQETYGLRPGDVLLNEGQALDLVGRSAIFSGPANAFCFQNTLIRFRCNASTMPEFCQALFKYWLDTRRFVRVARQTTSVAHLGADRFAEMPFPRPPLDEQLRIADCLRRHMAHQEAEESRLSKLLHIRSGLTDGLLTGRVRPPKIVHVGDT